MRAAVGPTAIAVIAFAFVPGSGAAEPPGVAMLKANVASEPIRIDGVLDDAAWANAAVISDLTQQDPHPGEATPFRTEVRVLVDEDNVYLAFHCFDPDPDRIAIHTLKRDGDLDGDDHVTIVLDTFLDYRNGYYFSMNAAGAKVDGLILGPEDSSSNWDGIWDGQAQKTANGWTAEFALPAKTLHYTRGASEWGFNVERVVPRELLHVRWTGISLDAELTDMQRNGRLAGIEGLRQGLGLTFIPYGLVRYEWQRSDDDGAVKPEIGGDLYYNITPSLTSVLTVNTDFAETEVDVEQVNLTRFPLFFPETREFFLEGSTNFDFGVGLGTDLIPFFSRRIGLFDARRVPILAGIKLFGRAGRWGFGVVDAYTDNLAPEGDSPGISRTNLGAARVTLDVDEHLRIGTIVTDGDPSGLTENRLFGADFVWQTSTLFGEKNLTAGGWWTLSAGDVFVDDTAAGDVAGGDRQGYGASVDYPNDLWDLNIDYRHFGDALDPKLGFLPRRNVNWYSGYAAYQPRPDGGPFAWARQFFFELEPEVLENLDGVTETWRVFVAPFNVTTQEGDHYEANWIPEFERLLEPFEISPGVVIPPGGYHFTQYRLQAESSAYRPLSGSATTSFGGFYTGRLLQTILTGSAATRTGRHRVELSTENDFVSLPEGDFIERLHQLRWTYTPTPYVVFSLFSQYESEEEHLGWNARFRWTIKPGNDFYVVWTRNWLRTDPEAQLRFQRDSDAFAVKLRWTFRK